MTTLVINEEPIERIPLDCYTKDDLGNILRLYKEVYLLDNVIKYEQLIFHKVEPKKGCFSGIVFLIDSQKSIEELIINK